MIHRCRWPGCMDTGIRRLCFKVALSTFSSFDGGNKPPDQAEPKRFYHGFVLGMVVNMADTCKVRSNRERGQYELCSYGRYDVMIEPLDRSAHARIEEKQYEAELVAEGFAPEQIRKYGFAFQGKKCLIG